MLIIYRASGALTFGSDCPTSHRQTTTRACLQRVGRGRPRAAASATLPCANGRLRTREKEFRVWAVVAIDTPQIEHSDAVGSLVTPDLSPTEPVGGVSSS